MLHCGIAQRESQSYDSCVRTCHPVIPAKAGTPSLAPRFRGDDGVLRGNDGTLRGDDGVLRGDDGVLRGDGEAAFAGIVA